MKGKGTEKQRPADELKKDMREAHSGAKWGKWRSEDKHIQTEERRRVQCESNSTQKKKPVK